MRCRVCGEPHAVYLWAGHCGDDWFRCLACGSDSSTVSWEETRPHYDADYCSHNLRASGGMDALIRTMESNLDWFGQFEVPRKNFLDVGCNEGAGMEGMRRRGWGAWGFDINPSARAESVQIAEELHADLFEGARFGAVMLREVLEHPADWKGLLEQSARLVMPGGLLQVQTPRPCRTQEGIPYCGDHLQLFSPAALRAELLALGLVIEDHFLWPIGQKWMARRP